MEGISKISFLVSCLLTAKLISGFQQGLSKSHQPSLVLLHDACQQFSDGYTVNTAQNQVLAFVRMYRAYSARGMWAFYTAQDFQGESYAVVGEDGMSQTPSCFTFSAIKSIRPLSDPASTAVDKFEGFSNVKFLGDSTGVKSNSELSSLQPLQIKSIALYVATRHVIMCAETNPNEEENRNNCVCLNGLERSSYVVPDLTRVPLGSGPSPPTLRIRKIRQLAENEEELCYELPTLGQQLSRNV